jgi:hypothetical protein
MMSGMKLAIYLPLVASIALAQSAPQPTEPALPLPQNFAVAFVALNQYSTPQINGGASYARLISTSNALYSFTSYDVTSVKPKPFTVQTSTRTGIAAVIRQYGPLVIVGLGDAGVAAAANNLGGAFSGGGLAIYRLKNGFAITGGMRILKTSLNDVQHIYEIGFGRSW